MIVAGVDASPGPGAMEFYRSVWATGRAWLDRRWVRPAVEVGFIIAWLAIRMSGGHARLAEAWTAAAAVLAILSPVSGLVTLVGVAPWDAPLTLGHALGLRDLLVLVLGLAVVVRVLVRPGSLPRSLPVAAALGLLAVSLILGVGSMYVRNGRAIGWDSATFWLAGFGGAMIVFLVAAWVGHGGQQRALWTAVASATVAGLVSLGGYVAPAILHDLPLRWLLSDRTFGARLAGAIASPNAMVSLLVGPTAILAAAAAFARDRRLRLAAFAVLPLLILALALTYSRAAIIAVLAIAVIILWRWRRRVGVALLVAGIAAAAALTPAYLQARGDVLGGVSAVTPGKILIAGDEQRVTAWRAAARMWIDAPLTGFGFRSYRYLGPQYGDQVLGSPHNEWIRLFAEEGIAGGILGIAFVLLVARRIARTPGWLAIGCLGAFLGWAITASFNNPFLFLQVNAIAFTIAGVMIGRAQRSTESAVRVAG